MEIKQVQNVKDVWKVLRRYDDSFVRKLSGRVGDLKSYAEKLFRYAENYVMIQDDKEIGFFAFYANDIKDRKAYLAIIVVGEQYRKKGNGGQALQFVINECQEKQMDWLDLEVDKANENAICLYKANGFKVIGEISEVSFLMERKV